MSESLQKKVDKIITDYIENLQDLQAVALANNDKKEFGTCKLSHLLTTTKKSLKK